MLSMLDVKEFKDAAKESVDTNYEYLSYGAIFKDIKSIEYLNFYTGLLSSPLSDHFGLFDGRTLLGHISFQLGFCNLGTELMGWTRKDYLNRGIGEIGLRVAADRAINEKGFNFVQLFINENNQPSRKVAEKVGFLPVLKIKYETSSPNSMILYIHISPRVMRLARQYGRRPLDVIACPATTLGMTHFLSSDRVIQFYEWPFPDFLENARATNLYSYEDYVARMNFSPRNLENES
jgi:hypothetical protein